MTLLDMRTIIFSSVVTDLVCLLVILMLWHQTRKRFAGTGFWVLDFAFQIAAMLLIILRGKIPDWMSMVLANTLVIGGAILGYAGLGRFVGKKISQVHNYVLLAAFACVHAYFTLILPNQAIRNANVTVGLLIIFLQCTWFLVYRTEPGMRRLTLGVGMVFGGFSLVSIARIIGFFTDSYAANDFFKSGPFESLILVSYQILFILLTYSLALMFNKRLLMEVKTQEEKFAKTFHSSPYAITLTRLSNGQIAEVNDGFLNITGYPYAEVIGKTTLDLHLWDKEEDRAVVVNELSKSPKVQGREFQFRKKSGERITGLFSAEIILINDQKYILSSISDITERKQAEMQLEEVAEKYSALFNANSDGVWIHNLNGEILEVNDAYCQMSGYSRGELTHMPISRIVAVKTPEEIADHIKKVIETDGHDRFESRHRRKDGSIFNVDVTALFLGKDRGSIAVFVRDITERKRAEEALRASEERLRLAQEAGRVGIWDFNFATEELRWTPELEAIYGLEPGTVRTYQDFATHVYPDDLKTMETKRNEAVNQQKTFEYEFRIQRSCGETAWVYCRGGATYDPAGRPTRVFGVNIDITDRKHAEEALKRAHEELEKRIQERTSELSEAVERLRAENIHRKQLEDILRDSEIQVRFFASQCLTAQETERKRVAGELHDSIAASLSALKFKIDKIAEEVKQGHHSLESLQDLSFSVTEINNEVRRIMADLRPSILDDLGIIPAITWFCREFQKTYSHISVEKQIRISEHEVPDSLKTPIFRISQEAMNNIAKHSQASSVSLSLQERNGGIELAIQDNGDGFDPNTTRRGLGLSTMRERAQLSGGFFAIESAKGKGTVIHVSWPGGGG